MDSTAISLCMDNKMPIVVFDMDVAGNLKRVVLGDAVGSHGDRSVEAQAEALFR